MASSHLRSDSFVRLQKLAAKPELNGQIAQCVRYVKDRERWQVRIVGGTDSGTLAVRSANLDALGTLGCQAGGGYSLSNQDITAMLQTSEAMLTNGDYAGALTLREKLLATCLESLGNTHTFIATCLNNVGQVHERRALAMDSSSSKQADIDQAERCYLEAVRRRIRLHGSEHHSVGQSWLYLGRLYANVGRWRQAGQVLLDSAEILKSYQNDVASLSQLGQLLPLALAELSVDVGSSLCFHRLLKACVELRRFSSIDATEQSMIEAVAALAAGSYFEAESLIQRCLRHANVEKDSDREGYVWEMLASVYMRQHCPHQAEQIYNMMLARGMFSSKPSSVMNMAHVLASTYRCKEAIASLHELLASESLALRPDLQEAALHNLGCYLIDDGQFKEAETIIGRCLTLRKESGSIDFGTTCTNLGVCILRQSRERVEDALPFLWEALHHEEKLAASSLERRVELLTASFNVAFGLLLQGQTDDAESHMLRALQGLVSSCYLDLR